MSSHQGLTTVLFSCILASAGLNLGNMLVPTATTPTGGLIPAGKGERRNLPLLGVYHTMTRGGTHVAPGGASAEVLHRTYREGLGEGLWWKGTG